MATDSSFNMAFVWDNDEYQTNLQSKIVTLDLWQMDFSFDRSQPALPITTIPESVTV